MNFKDRLSQIRTVGGILHGSRAFVGPFQAALWLTNRCNVRCIHCFYHSPHVTKPNLFEVRRAKLLGEEPPDDTYIRNIQKVDADRDRTHSVMDELITMGTRQILFTGVGEPFLHKDAVEFMARAKHAGLTCIVNTNGTLLDRVMIDELIKMNFDELRITLMAGSRDMYVKTHPTVSGETFDRLKANLLYLAERKAELGTRKPAVNLPYIVVSANHDGLFDFAEFANHVRADRLTFRAFDDCHDSGLAGIAPTPEQAASVAKQLIGIKAYLDSMRISHNISYFLKFFREQLDTTGLYNMIPCYMGWLSARINLTNGNVYPCCKCYEPLGNVYEKSFREIWKGQTYRKFRRYGAQINRRKTVLGCQCNRCSNHIPNLRVYRMLHPIKGRSAELDRLRPSGSGKEDRCPG